MKCPDTGLTCDNLRGECGDDGEYCYLERYEAEHKTEIVQYAKDHQMAVDNNGLSGPRDDLGFPITEHDECSRGLVVDKQGQHMPLGFPLRVDTRLPSQAVARSQGIDTFGDGSGEMETPIELEKLMSYQPVDSVTDENGSHRPALYGRDVPWPEPKTAAGQAAYISEMKERERMLITGRSFGNDYRPPLLMADKARLNAEYGRMAAPNVPPLKDENKYVFSTRFYIAVCAFAGALILEIAVKLSWGN